VLYIGSKERLVTTLRCVREARNKYWCRDRAIRHDLAILSACSRGIAELNVILVGWQRPIAGAGSVGGG
jgi:hypothetical protein